MNLSPLKRQILITAVPSAICTLLVFLIFNFLLNHSWNLFGNNNQQFSVQGTASLSQKPDSSLISFTVTKTAVTLKDAQSQANTSMNTIVSDLKKLGIADKDIKTSNYNSYPNYDTSINPQMKIAQIMPVQRDQTIVNYTVTQNVDVSLSDITKANTVIDIITKDGAENISGPNLSFSQSAQDELSQKVRLLAIADAKKKAEVLANAAGIRLGRVVNIQESGNAPLPIQPMMLKAQDSSAGSAPTQINPGENTISETVILYYQTW